jgi:hypothetical protein
VRLHAQVKKEAPLFGFEQEYTMLQKGNGLVLGWPEGELRCAWRRGARRRGARRGATAWMPPALTAWWALPCTHRGRSLQQPATPHDACARAAGHT